MSPTWLLEVCREISDESLDSLQDFASCSFYCTIFILQTFAQEFSDRLRRELYELFLVLPSLFKDDQCDQPLIGIVRPSSHQDGHIEGLEDILGCRRGSKRSEAIRKMMRFLHIIGLETGQASNLGDQQWHNRLVTLFSPINCLSDRSQHLSMNRSAVINPPDSSTWKDVVSAAMTDLQSSVSLLGLLAKAVKISVVKGDNVLR